MDAALVGNLQQKIAVLSGDVRLLEKKREKLILDLDSIQSSQQSQLQSYSKELKKSKEEYAATLTLLNNLRVELQNTETALTQARLDLKSFNEGEGQVILEAVKTERAGNATILSRISIESDLLEAKKRNLTNLEIVLSNLKTSLLKKEKELETKDFNFNLEIEELAAWKAGIEEEAVLKVKEIKELEVQITSLKIDLNNLDVSYKKMLSLKETTEKDLEKRIAEVVKREKAVAGRETLTYKKAMDLQEKEKWLHDREQTLGRAYDEVVQRGGLVG